MKILIIGCGKVGSSLVMQLCNEEHDITVVDTDSEKIEEITNHYDVIGLVGNGANTQLMQEAFIDHTDLMIAMTGNDELNMICCLIARKLGCAQTIARVHNPEYGDELRLIQKDLGLALTINPEFAAALEAARLLKFPSAQKIDTFARGKVEIVKYKLPAESVLKGTRIADIPQKFDVQVLICAVEREDDVIIPNGDFVLEGGDMISFVATTGVASALFGKLGLGHKKISTCMIIGGGGVAYYLAEMLLRMKVRVTIIDKNRERCAFLSQSLEGAMVICADAVDQEILEEEGIREMDAVVAMTNVDETNLLLSLYAKEVSHAKLITKVHRISYDGIVKSLDLDSIICPKNIVADTILQFVRATHNSMGSNVETLYKIIENKAEALEFYVKEGAPVLDIPIMELNLKSDLIIASIRHGNQVEIPNGRSVIHAGDSVVVVTTRRGLSDISDILN